MLGQIISAKAAAAVLAGAVATSGAAALGSTIADGQQSHSSAAPTQTSATLSADRQNGPAADDTGKGKGQGAKISALAKSTPGGPGKGAIISAAAKGHGQAVSAEARKNGKAHAPKGAVKGNQPQPNPGTQPAQPAQPAQPPMSASPRPGQGTQPPRTVDEKD